MRHNTNKRTVIPYLLFLATATGAVAASAAECEIVAEPGCGGAVFANPIRRPRGV